MKVEVVDFELLVNELVQDRLEIVGASDRQHARFDGKAVRRPVYIHVETGFVSLSLSLGSDVYLVVGIRFAHCTLPSCHRSARLSCNNDWRRIPGAAKCDPVRNEKLTPTR